jgi:2-octaprenylphenol hydroxylase
MQRLGEAFEFRLGKILEIDDRASFPLWQRHATDYVQDNIALIGDAAHSIHPLAGQGVNMGFADVEVLSQVISSALVKGEDFACHQTLSRYQRARKGQNMTMMAAMEGFKRLFGSEDPGLKWLRNSGLKLTDNLPGVKKQLMRQAMGL